jgi:SAM-dependent methyltransferase
MITKNIKQAKKNFYSHQERLWHLLCFLDKYIDTQKSLKILDIGGTEVSEEVLNQKFPNSEIRILNWREKPSKKIVVGDAQNIPFDQDFFNLVICIELIEHVYQPQLVMREIRRVGRKNSLILLTTPNMNAWYNRLLMPFGYMPANYTVVPFQQYGNLIPKNADYTTSQDHCRVFNLQSLRQLVENEGFNVLATFGVNYCQKGHRFFKIRKYATYLMFKTIRENIGIVACNKKRNHFSKNKTNLIKEV